MEIIQLQTLFSLIPLKRYDDFHNTKMPKSNFLFSNFSSKSFKI